jgi:putative pyruvate formate lyase activating enzyme
VRSSARFEPAYRRLGVAALRERAAEALEMLRDCRVCPRDCRVNRLEDRWAVCKTGRRAIVSSYFPHFGEEDCLRGWRGSGTIFFSMCNLKCVFCQNFEISHLGEGRPVPPEALAAMMLALQDAGCHNINLVTPEHVVPQVLEALPLAVEAGLRLPLVYNTSAFDSLHSLRLLEGIVDIYMPDFKVWDREVARRYLLAPSYPEVARAAIGEMHRQVGDLVVDERGLALRGVLVRHLVMPGGVAGTPEIMRWLATLSADMYVNLMAQYAPAGKVSASRFPELNRPVTATEMADAYAEARAAGLWRFDRRALLIGQVTV